MPQRQVHISGFIAANHLDFDFIVAADGWQDRLHDDFLQHHAYAVGKSTVYPVGLHERSYVGE